MTTSSMPAPIAAMNRHTSIPMADSCSPITTVAAAYHSNAYVKIGLRPRRSAIVENITVPRYSPAKVAAMNVAWSVIPNSPERSP